MAGRWYHTSCHTEQCNTPCLATVWASFLQAVDQVDQPPELASNTCKERTAGHKRCRDETHAAAETSSQVGANYAINMLALACAGMRGPCILQVHAAKLVLVCMLSLACACMRDACVPQEHAAKYVLVCMLALLVLECTALGSCRNMQLTLCWSMLALACAAMPAGHVSCRRTSTAWQTSSQKPALSYHQYHQYAGACCCSVAGVQDAVMQQPRKKVAVMSCLSMVSRLPERMSLLSCNNVCWTPAWYHPPCNLRTNCHILLPSDGAVHCRCGFHNAVYRV